MLFRINSKLPTYQTVLKMLKCCQYFQQNNIYCNECRPCTNVLNFFCMRFATLYRKHEVWQLSNEILFAARYIMTVFCFKLITRERNTEWKFFTGDELSNLDTCSFTRMKFDLKELTWVKRIFKTIIYNCKIFRVTSTKTRRATGLSGDIDSGTTGISRTC